MSSGDMSQWAPHFYVGLHEDNKDRFVTAGHAGHASELGFDLLTSPITNSKFQNKIFHLFKNAASKQQLPDLDNVQMQDVEISPVPPLDHLDTSLVPGAMATQILGVTSGWLDLASPDPLVAGISKQVLTLEVQYAAFCGIDHVIIEGPRIFQGDAVAGDVAKYARAIQDCLEVAPHTSFYIRIPLFDHPDIKEPAAGEILQTREEYLDNVDELSAPEADFFGRWDSWNTIRTACKYNARLSLGLVIPKHIPDTALQSRWFSEPVRLAIFESDSFLRDARGNVGLSKPSREFLSRIMCLKITPWILVSGAGTLPDPTGALANTTSTEAVSLDGPTPAEANNSKAPNDGNASPMPLQCLQYFRYLQQSQQITSDVERYGTGYQDYLQVPLQPLTDNLESMTYEVFEKDPVKYDLYEEAIAAALRDWKDHNKPTSGSDGKVLITVAGAGRGPLVTRAMFASAAENVPIELWAVEKNPNAFVLLQKHNSNLEKWDGAVQLVQSDMRSWAGPVSADGQPLKIDILVTELLGSFGDNELSPECLDGILHHLAPQGISIPRSYTPYLTPVSAPKIHADVMNRASWEPTAPETPAVVWLHSIDYLSIGNKHPSGYESRSPSGSVSLPPLAGELNVLPVWTFNHGPQVEVPLKTTNKHNERFSRLSFRCKNRGVCHGLGGYFESVLYPGVDLSTNPNTIDEKSPDMISWFPIFFPLKTPMYIPDNSSVTCSIWRYTDGRKVWYEWMTESWMLAANHQRIKLSQSELHSSIKNGCMM